MTRPIRRASLATLALALGTAAAPAYDGAPGDTAVERGRYIATAAGCASCHSAEGAPPYAGGSELSTPFGTLVVPNVTPHRDTGIGDWTYDDFEGSLRRGVDDEGTALYPAQPYVHYTRMTDGDVRDLWAYMRSLDPVENAVSVVQLPFPFNVRQGIDAWQALFFERGRFEPDPDASAVERRGRYLVDALGHCGACHTPRNALGAQDPDRYLRGSRIHNWYAPDISNRPGSALAKWEVESLTDWLMADHARNNVPAFGTMWRVTAKLAELERDDVRAMAVYLKGRDPEGRAGPPPATEVDATDAAPAAPDAGDADVARGEGIYLGKCAFCHGTDGEGRYGVAASLVDNGGVTAAEPLNVISVLLQGIPPRGAYGVMPSYADSLTDAEIAAVSNYVRTAWDNAAPPNADPRDVAALRDRVEPVDPAVRRAGACPSVPASHLDRRTRRDAAELAAAGPDALDGGERLSALWDAEAERHPRLTRTERLTALQSAYCLALAERDLDEDEVARRTTGFVMALAPVTRGDAPGE